MPPAITPVPPESGGGLPVLGRLIPFLRNPTTFLEAERARLGDTFALDLLRYRLLCVFGPVGVRSLYALPEDQASFGEATRALLGLKLPRELQAGDLAVFQHLFNRERMEGYVAQIHAAVDDALAELPATGTFEVFAYVKRLVHRIGFRCWAGREAATRPFFDPLVACFERIDPEEAFVNPSRLFLTILMRKAPERRALRRAVTLLREVWMARVSDGHREDDVLDQLHALFAGDDDAARHERVAKNVMVLHLASLSNLYAALAWTLVDLLLRPAHRAAVDGEAAALASRYGDGASLRDPRALAEMTTLESCLMESIRLAQRSLTLRKVVRPCAVDTDAGTFHLEPGVFVATLLSVNNTAHDSLGEYDPAHYERGRLADRVRVPAKEMVSTFGHGRHACVGERFAAFAIKIAVRRHLDALELEPLFTRATAPRGQMGAVARSAEPCLVRFRRRPA